MKKKSHTLIYSGIPPWLEQLLMGKEAWCSQSKPIITSFTNFKITVTNENFIIPYGG